MRFTETGSGHSRWLQRAWSIARPSSALSVLFALALAGCARKAPSIEQCQEIAVRLIGVDRSALRLPNVRTKVEEVAFECLTTPYDQQLYRCLASAVDNQACVIEFRQRSPTQSAPAQQE